MPLRRRPGLQGPRHRALLRSLARSIVRGGVRANKAKGKPPQAKEKPPKPVRNVKVRIDMSTAKITWVLPPKRAFAADLAGVDVSISADAGVNLTPVETVAATSVQESTVSDVPAGDWLVRLIVRDVNGQPSNVVDTPFNIGDTDPPDAVTDVVVTLS